jgi:uncharacterized membrane protein YgcG
MPLFSPHYSLRDHSATVKDAPETPPSSRKEEYSVKSTRMAVLFPVVLLAIVCLAASVQADTYSRHELNEILAPIALYPDPVIAQILPACSFPDQLSEAAGLLPMSDSDIESHNWDVSVQAVAHYPNVLTKLVAKPDWAASIGQAYASQPDDVMAAIQHLRRVARAHGYCATNQYQDVFVQDDYVRITPLSPEYIYCPDYDPSVVFVDSYIQYPNALAFGAGLLIGVWLDRDCDWESHRVFYTGWQGGGWIGNSRGHVNLNDSHYVNSSWGRTNVTVNHAVASRDISSYRTTLRSSAGHFRGSHLPAVNHAAIASGSHPRPNMGAGQLPSSSQFRNGSSSPRSMGSSVRSNPSAPSMGRSSTNGNQGRSSSGSHGGSRSGGASHGGGSSHKR